MSSVRVLEGDCRDVLPTLDRIDCCVTDPPYHLTTIGRSLQLTQNGDGTDQTRQRNYAERGFMSKEWDGGDIAFRPDTWWPVFTALKPGAHLVAFGGSRTFHRMVCAIEDAGFIIHPMLGWITGCGFPKATRFKDMPELGGWRYGLQALKPAIEPICMAQKPMEGTGPENWRKHGVGGLNIDACRVEGAFESGWSKSGSKASENVAMSGPNYARDPKSDNPAGRWPANVLHDGSPEVLEAFAAFGEWSSGTRKAGIYGAGGSELVYGERGLADMPALTGSTGSAARFFYSSKADKADRADSRHPTVKPVDLMRWLVRLVCPPGGTVLDPFAGSGTTGEAAMLEGMNAILVEKSLEHAADIRHRIRRWSGLDQPLFADVAD